MVRIDGQEFEYDLLRTLMLVLSDSKFVLTLVVVSLFVRCARHFKEIGCLALFKRSKLKSSEYYLFWFYTELSG